MVSEGYTVVFDNELDANSSAFERAFHDNNENVLYIKFWNGTAVSYTNFSKSDWESFSDAMSKGAYYNGRIKASRQHSGSFINDSATFVKRKAKIASKSGEFNHSSEPSVNITVNVFFSGDPQEIAKAVERLAPSIRAINNLGKV